MSQSFHNRRMNLFFDGCQNLFGQLVAEMSHRGEVKGKVDNDALGHLNVDVNFGVGFKASSTMVIEPFSFPAGIKVSNRISMISTSTLMSSFATDMNEMFNRLVVSLISSSEMPSGVTMALLVTKVTVGAHTYNSTLSVDLQSSMRALAPSQHQPQPNILMPGDTDSLPDCGDYSASSLEDSQQDRGD